ncbi:hypothetical protein [Salmonirosea aquatica]|uniref:Uncharacterized protein n=1 Tax=Salmonirosea aquatica TaxID=2654236 RepID=A0A7C9FYV2_9BACT|nr:hypothetical protein [Cytophagaceae bacterium SJW1-29]
MDQVNLNYEDNESRKLNREEDTFGISKISQVENDMAKWTLAHMCKIFYETFIEYSPITRDEREQYFQENNSHPNIHILKNILVPLNVYVIDRNQKKAILPFGFLEDNDFIIDEHIISQSTIYYTRSEFQRDNFYSFSNAIKGLDLNNDDASQVFFIILCDLLSARIQVFKKNKTHHEIPDLLDNQSSLNINFLKCFIDFDKLTDIQLHDIYEQEYFFEHYTDYKIWCELDGLIEKIFSIQHTEIVNNVANDLTKKPHEKFEYISSKIFKLSSSKAKQLRLGRTNNLQYLDYELEIFQRAIEHSKNLIQFQKLIQMDENQTNNFYGLVGQFNTHSTIKNANVDMRSSNRETSINEIKTILEELKQANIDNKDWQEALVKCISEFHEYESLNSVTDKQVVSTRLNTLFVNLKEIRDKFELITFPIEVYSKIDVILGLWHTLPSA